MNRIERLLARKAELTPGLVMATPGSPFPWYQVPFVHGIMQPNRTYANGAITTDDLGLRKVEINGELLGFRQFQQLPGKKRLLIGASTAFSMGTSSDRTTIASCLSRLTGEPWFSLSVVSYVSTEELLLYCLTDPKDIEEIVILSGMNTLSACLLSPRYLSQDVFTTNFFTLPGMPEDLAHKALRSTRRGLKRLFCRAGRRTQRLIPDQARPQLALSVIKRDLELFRAISEAKKTTITFVAQPLLTLLSKRLSAEEAEISQIQRELGEYEEFALWGLYFNALPECYRAYCASLGEICRNLGIAYLDLNQDHATFDTSDWLFCDQAHLTDQGCLVCAERLCELVCA